VLLIYSRLPQGEKCRNLGRHEHREGHEMQPRQHLRQPLEVPTQPSEPRHPAETAFHHPAPGPQHEPLLRLRQLHHLQLDPRRLGIVLGLIARVALIRLHQLDRLACRTLHRLAQRLDLGALLLVGWGHRQGQQVAHRVHRHVDLRAHLALVAVVARTRSALTGTLQRAPVDHRRTGLAFAALADANDAAHVAHHGLETPGLVPAPPLLVDRRPGRKVIGQQPPRCASAGQPAQRVEHLAQRVAPLRGLFVDQRQVRRHEVPLFGADVARVRLSVHRAILEPGFSTCGSWIVASQ